MINEPVGISILNKLQISTEDVVLYMESVNTSNTQILKVLEKTPALPGYKYLPWFIEFSMDLAITTKLRENKLLNKREASKLKGTLEVALQQLRRGHDRKRDDTRVLGLQAYINTLVI